MFFKYIKIFYFTVNKNLILLLDWILKKDNKIKDSVLNKIILYKKDYEKRFNQYSIYDMIILNFI